MLVLNAGVVKLKYEKSVDGWEKTLVFCFYSSIFDPDDANRLQTNHLGSVLLALLLFPFLSCSQPLPSSSTTAFPRITIVGSDAHHFVKSVPGSKEKGGMLERLNERGYCTKKKKVMRERYGITKCKSLLLLHKHSRLTRKDTQCSTSSSPAHSSPTCHPHRLPNPKSNRNPRRHGL